MNPALEIARPYMALAIEIRPDCDCSICRTDRGLEPLTTSELAEKRLGLAAYERRREKARTRQRTARRKARA